MIKKAAFILMSVFCSSTGSAKENVQLVLDRYKDSITTYGIVALVSANGKQQTGHVGYAYKGKPIVNEQLFGIGSNTKLFTATIILKLQQQNKLNIDDHIGKYIDPQNKYIDTTITIRQLLNHSSGIKDYTSGEFLDYYQFFSPKAIFSDQKILDQIDTVDFPKGSRHDYSNSNFFLLRLIIEKITDKPIDVVLDEMIIKPCGLSHTFGYLRKDIPSLAHPTQRGNDYIDLSFKTLTDQAKGAGQMVSSVSDLCKFFDLLLIKKKILSREMLAEMLQFEHGDDGDDYGLGIFRSTIENRALINHTGRITGYQSFLYCDVEKKVIYVVLTNDMNDQRSYKILKSLVREWSK